MRLGLFILLSLFFLKCQNPKSQPSTKEKSGLELMILGIAQDAGYPQAGCLKSCCQAYIEGKEPRRSATSLAILDYDNGQKWLFEASPDIKDQLYRLHKAMPESDILPNGVFLTHAHVGHYTGLMHFGREIMGTKELPVFAMPQMQSFLKNNGPWSQLVDLKNISLQPLKADSSIQVSQNIQVSPFRVPHRDEFSETVGYQITTSNKTILFIPDIDKWQKWKTSIIEKVKEVDLAILDGTFYNNEELPNRDMSEIPHPFIVESMDIFNNLSDKEKQKVMFIHFNHTNPLLRETTESQKVRDQGFQIAREGFSFKL